MKYLARSNASTLGLLGSGWQGKFQVAAARVARNLKLVKVYSPSQAHRERFARNIGSEYGLNIRAVESAKEAAVDVDILIAATNVNTPIIPGEFVQNGMLVAPVNSHELSDEARAKADLWVALSSKRPLSCVGGEGQYGRLVTKASAVWEDENVILLEDIITGKAKGRTRDDEVTMFYSGSGMGIQFAALSAKAYQLAKKGALGREVPTEWLRSKS